MAGIYIHVPFCTAKCAYCDFYSVARPDMAVAYVGAVARELSARMEELGGEAVTTLYVGGGTPSLLSGELFAGLVSGVDMSSVSEFTVEANPDDVDEALVASWLSAGVNRVSLGVQSLDDSELRAVGRRHDAAGALRAIDTIRRGGIDNISGDLIYGLPGQTALSWERSLGTLLDTGITHLSAYCLSYEEGTLLWRRLERGLVTPADDGLIETMYATLCSMARRAGMEHYEISNFAMPGRRSAHNSSYWRDTPYLGLGPGAHSRDARGIRRYVPDDIRAYLRSPETSAVIDAESDTDRTNDRIMTSLRTAEGLDLRLFTPGERERLTRLARRFIDMGALTATAAGFAIPEEKFLISDAIIRELLL